MSVAGESEKGRGRADGGIRRGAVAFHVAAQTLLLAAGLVIVNVAVFQNPLRFDVTGDRDRDLAPATRGLLRGLREPVTVYAVLQKNNPLAAEIVNTLREFQREGRRRVEVRQVSPYADFGEAAELQRRFKFGLRENIVIVEGAGRHVILGMPDLAEFDLSGVAAGQPPRVVSSHVEMAVAGAILEVVSGEKKRVLYLTGHGEPDLEGEDGLAGLAEVWKRQNIRLEAADLRLMPEIEGDVAAVILAGPKYDLLPEEAEALRRYLGRRGRLMVFLEWGARTDNLYFLLSGFGISPAGDRVLMTRGTGPVAQLYRDVMALPNGEHAATRRLKGTTVFLRGATQSLRLARTPALAAAPVPLLVAAEGYWGETDQEALNAGMRPELDAGRDNRPPLAVAAAAELAPAPETGGGSQRARPGRVVVVGSASCLDPDAITPGVADFTSSALNWLLDREGLAGTGPRPPRQFEVSLSEREIRQVTLIVLVALPGLAAAAAVVMWGLRRR